MGVIMDDQSTPDVSKRRLGRGLNALLGTAAMMGADEAAPGVQSEISIELIDRNPFQPRKDFDPAALNELIDSIRQHGVLQPVIVRPMGDHYQLIAGERRLIAAKRAGLEHVPCRVLELSDQQVCEVSLEENLKRQDLGVLEKAQAFHEYLERFQCTVEELSRRLSLDRSTVSNMIRLLDLPDSIKQRVSAGQLTGGHARALLSLPAEAQEELAEKIVSQSLSVRKTEEAVRDKLQEGQSITIPISPDVAKSSSASGMTAHLESLQSQLRDLLAASVEIKLKGKEKGRIIIEFQSNDDFERIVGCLRRAA